MDPQPLHLTAPSRATAVAGAWLLDTGGDDDLLAMAEIGLTSVRIGLPWALTEVKPGRLDGALVEAFIARAALARSVGLEVWAALSAPEVPRWFDNDGGFTDDRLAATAWPRWVDLAAQSIGEVVDGWVPLEAPFAMAARLVSDDPRRHGEVMHHLTVAWRDAWRILRGTSPVATSLDVRVVRPADATVPAAELARREDQLRWGVWMRALRDGTVSIPGRADREVADLAGSCDVLGIAVRDDVEACLHRAAESGPDRPLAVVLGLSGSSDQQRSEHLSRQLDQCDDAARELALERVTVVPWLGGLVDSGRALTACGRVVAARQPSGAASSDSNASSAAPSNDASSPS